MVPVVIRPDGYDYPADGLGALDPAWITGGTQLFSSIFGGRQAKKQRDHQLKVLQMQNQLSQQNANEALELERIRLQTAQIAAQNQFNRNNMGGNNNNGGNNNTTALIIGGVLVAGLGLFFITNNKSDSNESEKKPTESLNGLVDTLED